MDYCTRKNIVNNTNWPDNRKVAGKYYRLPLNEGDSEGGLRLQGQYKSDREHKPLITYITVVYNRINTLPRCAESIWNQSYDNVEYIIIDGGSTDGTVEWIKQHEDYIDYFISQKDKGIYDAMNKGISVASGRYICFINSDDMCKEDAAQKVADICICNNSRLIGGRRELLSEKGEIVCETDLPRYAMENAVLFPLPIHHQSVYAHAILFEELGYYDTTYTFIADYKWEITAIKEAFFSEEVLSVFSLGGLTGNASPIARWDEWCRLCCEKFPMLSFRQAEILHYAIRHFWKNCEIPALLRSVRGPLKNVGFRKMLFETCWYICYVEAYFLKRTITNKKMSDMVCGSVFRLFAASENISSIEDVLRYIDGVLSKSALLPATDNAVMDFSFVAKLKHALNSCYYEVEMYNVKNKELRKKKLRQHRKAVLASKSGRCTCKMAKKRFE